jgi:hypothetical protein
MRPVKRIGWRAFALHFERVGCHLQVSVEPSEREPTATRAKNTVGREHQDRELDVVAAVDRPHLRIAADEEASSPIVVALCASGTHLSVLEARRLQRAQRRTISEPGERDPLGEQLERLLGRRRRAYRGWRGGTASHETRRERRHGAMGAG